MSESSFHICVWHKEHIDWIMCISLGRFTTGVSISCVCVCVYIGISTVWGTNVCPNTHLSDWLNIFLLKFFSRWMWIALTNIWMLSILPIDLSITQALIYPQHTLIRLAQVCGSKRSGLGFGLYLLRLAKCDFQRFGVCEECCWLCVHNADCLQTSRFLSEHPDSNLFYVSSFCCRVLVCNNHSTDDYQSNHVL